VVMHPHPRSVCLISVGEMPECRTDGEPSCFNHPSSGCQGFLICFLESPALAAENTKYSKPDTASLLRDVVLQDLTLCFPALLLLSKIKKLLTTGESIEYDRADLEHKINTQRDHYKQSKRDTDFLCVSRMEMKSVINLWAYERRAITREGSYG
jgi:hypothetical protein